MQSSLPPSAPSADRLRRGMLFLLIAVFLGVTGLRLGNLWTEYNLHVEGIQKRAEKLAHILSDHLERTVSAIDAALTQLALHSQRVGGPRAQPHAWAPVLDAALPGLAGTGSLTVIGDTGLVMHSTIPAIIGQTRAERFLFRTLASDERSGLVADTLFRSLRDGRPLIPLGRRLSTLDGQFNGTVVATLELERLRDFYRSIGLGPDGIISILHSEGAALLHEPPSSRAEAISTDTSFARLRRSSGDGSFRGPFGPGSPRYFTAYRTLSNPPLVLAVSLDEEAVLADWWEEVVTSLLGLALVGVLLAGAWFLVRREIQAREEADTALRNNQARFHEIMYHAPILVSVKDTEGRIKFINKALEDVLGTDLAEASDKLLRDIIEVTPADLIASLDREVAEAKAPLQRELTYLNNGRPVTALFVKFPLFDKNGDVESVVSFSTDLTEQRRSANWFRTIMDHAPSSVALKDLEGRFLFVNRALEQSLGIEASELLGKRPSDVFPPDYVAAHDAFDREVLQARSPMQREFLASFPAGVRSVLFVKFPIFGPNGQLEGLGSIATDITEQKQVETQLAHAQRMEAVGQLTGGIAHDFNNLLTVIIGNSELLAAELKNDDRFEPLAQVTLDAAERGAALIQRLLAFGRRQTLEPRPTDVNLLIEEMEDIFAGVIGANTNISIRSADDLWPAMIDPVQLETAILNLVVNSRDAMPSGGRIIIEMSNVELDEAYRSLNPDAKPGDYVLVAVSDTGTGMSPEIAARVFEPFFTTKEVGKGTGLGLPTIYGFVKQSGGHVEIHSEAGYGTVVRLYIPRADAPRLVPDIDAEPPANLPGGRERILLVEDDRLVRSHTEAQLIELGYQVTTASRSEEAIKLARLTGRPDLLLTDIVMPGRMNGCELARRMREIWPDLKVIYTSGHAESITTELADGLSDGTHYLAKPFRRRDLACKVREALDAPARVKLAAEI